MTEYSSITADPRDYWDIKEAILFGLSKLKEKERICIELRFIKDLTLEEIGTSMGISCDRVRLLESNALRKLRHPNICRHLIGKEF